MSSSIGPSLRNLPPMWVETLTSALSKLIRNGEDFVRTRLASLKTKIALRHWRIPFPKEASLIKSEDRPVRSEDGLPSSEAIAPKSEDGLASSEVISPQREHCLLKSEDSLLKSEAEPGQTEDGLYRSKDGPVQRADESTKSSNKAL